jgi:thiamine kinase-like enzyme
MEIWQPVFSRIPQLSRANPEKIEIERLGGLTNRNYKITHDNSCYVLRIPGEGTNEYIDRKAEEQCARITAEVGVNADVLFFDPADGIQLTRFIDNSSTMNTKLFQDSGACERAAIAFRKVHTCGKLFSTRFELFSMIDEYQNLLTHKKATLPNGYAQVVLEAEAVREVLNLRELPLVACHCDPLAENFLDTGERMYIIDWEYSGNNDPMWDLGDLVIEAEMGQDQEQSLIEAYFDGDVPPVEHGRMVIYKAMCDLLWTLWGVIQHVNDNPADDFWRYAVNRFDRCRKLMGSDSFAEALACVRHG